MADGPRIEAMSRFRPSDSAAAWEGVVAANARAERLACRIVAARHALRRGESSESVLAILGSAAAADPLRALLADQDRAVPLLADCLHVADGGTPGWWENPPASPADIGWRHERERQAHALLAALREVAGL